MNYMRLLQLAEKQCLNSIRIQSIRPISNLPTRFLDVQDKWRERDQLSKRWQLIYKAPMDTVLNCLSTYLTLTTGLISIGGIYYATFVFDINEMEAPIIMGDDIVMANNAVEGLIYVGGFIFLHVCLKSILSKYVIRLYKDGDEYLAIYRGPLFNTIKKHKFNLNEFQKTEPIIIIPWSESRYQLGKKKGILLENYFKTPEYFNRLLYKKPSDDDDDDED